jgi:hypothetical protein
MRASSRASNPDPTRVTAQPALTTSRGAVWLIVGAVFCVVALGVFALQLAVQPVIPVLGMVGAVVLYLAMVVVRIATRAGRFRLITLAILFGTLVAFTLVCVLLVAAAVSPRGS